MYYPKTINKLVGKYVTALLCSTIGVALLFGAGKLNAGELRPSDRLLALARHSRHYKPLISYNSAPLAPDYASLFNRIWLRTYGKKLFDIFAFGPHEIQDLQGQNSYTDMRAIGAFSILREVGIPVEIDVASVKEWDCDANRTPGIALDDIRRVHDAGGQVAIIGMDEPLASGIGDSGCKMSINRTAEIVARFEAQVTRMARDAHLANSLRFIDMEPFPGIRLQSHLDYLVALRNLRSLPEFYTLDVARAQLNNAALLVFPEELSVLHATLRRFDTKFGLIIWSSVDPEQSDQSYLTDARKFSAFLRIALASPPELLFFSSWVTRSILPICADAQGCSRDSAWDLMGKKSVPRNFGGCATCGHIQLVRDESRLWNTDLSALH